MVAEFACLWNRPKESAVTTGRLRLIAFWASLKWASPGLVGSRHVVPFAKNVSSKDGGAADDDQADVDY